MYAIFMLEKSNLHACNASLHNEVIIIRYILFPNDLSCRTTLQTIYASISNLNTN